MLTRMSKYMYIGVLLLVIVLCFSIFSNAQPRFKIGFTSEGLGLAYGSTMVEGAKKLAEEFDIDLVVVDGQFSPEVQVNQIEDFVAQDCDLIIIHPNNAEVLGAKAQWAQSKGIPVIGVSLTLDPPSIAYVGNDYYAQGTAQLELLAKALNYKGKIIRVQGLPGTSQKVEIDKCMEEMLQKYPDIELLDQKPADWERDKAFTLMQSFLQAFPQIDGVVTESADMAIGIIQAIKDAGREEDGIIVIGCDGSKEEMASIKSGDEYGCTAFDPYEIGRVSIYSAMFILNQENKDLWKEIKSEVMIPFKVITKENVEGWKGF